MNNTYLNSKTIFLNSRNALINDAHSHATFKLNETILCPQGIDMYIALVSATMPCSAYNITTLNNTLIYSVNDVSKTITITPRNVSAIDLETLLNQLFTDEGDAIIATFNRQTLRYTFTSTTPFAIIGGTLLDTIGIQTAVTPSLTVIGYKPCDLSGTTAVYIRSNVRASTISTDNNMQTVLARVPMINRFGGLVNFYASSLIWVRLTEKRINSFDIILTDEDNDEIDFNGLHWTLEFLIDFRYTIAPLAEAPSILTK